MSTIKHFYNILRYGQWEWGWEMYPDKPMLYAGHFYHDGDWLVFHCYKLWVSVYY